MTRIAFTILGQPASKANSRELVTFGHGDKQRAAIIKSEAARTYEDDALRQIPAWARLRWSVPVRVDIRIYYCTERPDLDESVVLDVLQDRWKRIKHPVTGKPDKVLVQGGIYRNDRQVREKHIYHGIDKERPRAEIVVQQLHAQQADLLGAA